MRLALDFDDEEVRDVIYAAVIRDLREAAAAAEHVARMVPTNAREERRTARDIRSLARLLEFYVRSWLTTYDDPRHLVWEDRGEWPRRASV